MKKKIKNKIVKKISSKTAQKKGGKPDVVNKYSGDSWAYTKEVRDHFFKPKNLLWEKPSTAIFDGEGVVGSPACGDVMRVWLNIDSKKDKIKEFKWRTFVYVS